MNRQQWTQLVIILLFVGFSAISWGFRQLRAYQQRQAAKQAAERHRMDMLRTGRTMETRAEPIADHAPMQMPATPPDLHDEARRRLQELAQRRRAELEAMARRAAGGGAGGAGAARPIPGPRQAAPIPVQRNPQPRAERPKAAGGEQQRRAVEQARRRAEKEARAEAQHRAEQSKKAERSRAEADSRQAAAERQTAASAADDAIGVNDPGRAAKPALAAAIGAARLGPGGSAATAEQWRRAIVMMNVLGPPVSLREDGEGRREF